MLTKSNSKKKLWTKRRKQFYRMQIDSLKVEGVSFVREIAAVLVQEENKGDNLNIPLMAINRVPEGQEAETGTLRVDARADVSNLDDYDAVPIG